MAARMIAEHEAGSLASVYAEIRTRLGLAAVPNVFKAMAAVSHDVLLQNWTAFRETVLDGGLPRVLKEMVGLVVSRDSDCLYGVGFHTQTLASLGVSSLVVQSLVESGDSAMVSQRARNVLHFARAYRVDPEGAVPSALEEAGLSEDEVQEVVDTVLLVSGINRFVAEAGIPVDA